MKKSFAVCRKRWIRAVDSIRLQPRHKRDQTTAQALSRLLSSPELLSQIREDLLRQYLRPTE